MKNLKRKKILIVSILLICNILYIPSANEVIPISNNNVYAITKSTNVKVTSVSLNKTTATITVGSTDTLIATVAPSNATNQVVNWTTSNSKVATVVNGVVKAVSAGKATIKATTSDGKKTATCEVISSSIKNLASGKLLTSSVAFSDILRINDKSLDTTSYSDSTPSIGLQWVQLDLGASLALGDVKLWHYYGDIRKYHDVVVQVSNDSSFKKGVTTVFNNDTDNSSGLGIGKNAEYVETSAGKDISFSTVKARYVRLYSNGSTENQYNHYVEVEVYDGSTQIVQPSLKPLQHSSTFLDLPTYDGSDMSTHPSVQYFQDGWNGYKYWMAMTPNTGVLDNMENPSIYVSQDGITWTVPSGLINSLVPAPVLGHNCDTDMIYNAATKELYLYYLESDDVSGSYVKLLKSSDGVNWSAPEVVVTDFRAKYSVLSPTIEYVQALNKYYMWAVNAGNPGWQNQNNIVERRESTDGVNWSEPVAVSDFNQLGTQVWHLFIRYIPSKNEYWAIYPAYPNGSGSNNTMLYYAKSTDGMNWTTYAKPAIDKGATGTWDDKEIYRSSFIYDPVSDIFKVWYGGIQDSQYIWKIGYTQTTYTDFVYNLTH